MIAARRVHGRHRQSSSERSLSRDDGLLPAGPGRRDSPAFRRTIAVSIVENERVETLVRGLARYFVTFEGLRRLAVFDRPRTIVAKSGEGRAADSFNSTFARAIVDVGVSVEMSAVRSGNEKGTLERLVDRGKGSFFKPRKFQDERDCEAQLVEANTTTPSRATGVIPDTRR